MSNNTSGEKEVKLTKSELELGQKIDRCLQDTLIKVGSGVGLGIVFSVVLFRSKFFFYKCKCSKKINCF